MTDVWTSTLSRRAFVARAGAAAAAVPFVSATSYGRILGANDRIRLALIGAGSRGREVMSHMVKDPAVQLATICDVYDTNAALSATRLGGSPRTTRDYRTVLADREIDAVLVATPDHWHARMGIDSLAAGKDLYIEKPLTRTIAEGEALVRAAKRTTRVVQVGLQQRSGSHYQQAKREYFDSGRIGKVVQVRTQWYGYGGRRAPERPQPADLDWRGWLGPASHRPFDADQFANWRWYWDFGGGSITDLFTHWIDVVHWFTGDQHPSAASALGGNLVLPDRRPAPDTVNVVLEYPNARTVSFECSAVPSGRGWEITFMGTGGSLVISRDRYVWTANERGAEPVTVKPEEEGSRPHAQNFLHAVRTRTTPNSDVESGFLSSRATILAKQSYRERRRIIPARRG